jgi:uncharacterized NAD-dependent epimerase/dehydratase family protein
MKRPRFIILAEAAFGIEASKTAAVLIRYAPQRVTAVIDSSRAGQTAQQVLGFGGDIPVVASLEEGLSPGSVGTPVRAGAGAPSEPGVLSELRPDALLIGMAPQGGRLDEDWRPAIEAAIDAGLDVWSGLHAFLCDDPDLAERARGREVLLHDLRKPPAGLPVATGRVLGTDAYRLLTVGSDCNVGKMTAAMEIQRGLSKRGVSAAFAATGQTGILLAESGIAVDAVVSDFVAGAAELLTLEAADQADVVVVEGQGSLLHPGYSGVTLGLLHGSMPQGMVLCAMPSRSSIYSGRYDWVTIPPLDEIVRRYEEAATWANPPFRSRVLGVCLATYDLSEAEARHHVEHTRELTGLPTTDPIRFGVEKIVDAVIETSGR